MRRSASAACPRVTQIDRALQLSIADAEEALPAGSPLIFVVDDWLKMREQARNCRDGATR